VARREPKEEALSPSLSRLPPGRHGLPREFVTSNQRHRLAAGIIEAVSEVGYHAATISQIVAAAGVSRRTFYTYFDSKQECYLATYDEICDHLLKATEAAAPGETEWARGVAAKLAAVLDAFSGGPRLAIFTLAVPPRAGGEIAARYRASLDRALVELTEGMPPPPEVEPPSAGVRQALIAGLASLIVHELESAKAGRLRRQLPEMVELFLTPFVGRPVAARVAREAGDAGVLPL
jgi:AcrR family transcriptional regulator